MRAGAAAILAAMFSVAPASSSYVDVTGESSLSFDAEGAKMRPVSKVITLLKDMQKQMEKEADEDESVYDKTACWCETNDREKTKTIADAEARIEDLTSKIEQGAALSGRLNTEIANLQKELKANQGALDTAGALRTKQLKEFNSEEKDLLGSISSLKAATVTLDKHNSLMQLPREGVDSVLASVQEAMKKHASLLAGVLTHSERRVVTNFVQAPQGGEIFGILKQMRETFETNLSTTQKEEAGNQKAFEELKGAKEAEIQAGQDQLDTKAQELADTDEKNAQAKQDLVDTKKSLSSDQAFLASLKDKCAMNDSEWQLRQKSRGEETQAVSKALAVLSSDDAHDLFSKTLGFVQKDSSMHSERRSQASKIILAVAFKMQNPRLASLAVSVRINAFAKVKKAIDDMVAGLRTEKADEIKHKDFCIKEFNSNEASTIKRTRDKSDVIAKLEDLTSSIATLNTDIAKLKAEIADSQKELKMAGEDREKQNKDFQMTIADQRATQKLLKSALTVLKGFYAKKASALVEETSQTVGGPPPPAGFDTHKPQAAAGGVMGMIQQIINDAKALEAEAVRGEQDSQKAYEGFIKATNDSIETKNSDVVNKTGVKAEKEQDLVEAGKEKEKVLLQLEQLAMGKADLHSSCDFVVRNFDVRQSARDEEVEALKQAKAILSGAKFDAFLQGE